MNDADAIQQFFKHRCRAQLPLDPTGQERLGIPCVMLMGALREAGKGMTTGRHRAPKEVVTRADGGTTLFAFAYPEEDFLPFTHLGTFDIRLRKPTPPGDPAYASPWIVDRRKGGPNSHMIAVGGIVRPKFPQWGFTCSFLVDETPGYSVVLLRQLMERAGAHIGIGGFRSGGFGRFAVRSWTEQELTVRDLAAA